MRLTLSPRRVAARLFTAPLVLGPALSAGATSFTTLPFSAYDVSGDGSVVVGTSNGLAVRWTEAGGFQYLGSGEALAVSADGSVVVGAVYSGSSYQAFRWTQSGGRTTIGLGQAIDVSSDGSVVVGTMPPSGAAPAQAFRWTEADGMVGLGVLPGSSATQASADFDGFRWTEAGGMVGLGFPSQGFSAHCDAGEVIPSADGSILVGDGAGVVFEDSAFIWDASHGVRSLRQLLIDSGIDLSGWTLDNVAAISDDGRTIVGYGTNPNGQQEHWLAVLPEPATGLLLLLGLAGVAGWRRRPA